MPLFTKKSVGKKGILGIWHITESLDELLKMKNFSPEDLATTHTFSHEHRKKEWLAARILIDKLIEEESIEVAYDEHNKPHLKGSDKYISLSHSHSLLAVILDEAETGIDIEIIKPKIARIKHKFMSEAEFHSLQNEKQDEQLTVYWCTKESLYKLYGKKELTFKKNLLVEPFQYSENGIIKGWIKNTSVNRSFQLQYEKLSSGSDHYILTYVIHED